MSTEKSRADDTASKQLSNQGVLIECDPSIKALIVNIDSSQHNIILDELDDTHLMIHPSMVEVVKQKLNKMLAENTYNPNEEAAKAGAK